MNTTGPGYPTLTPDSWHLDGDAPIRGVRLTLGRQSIFIAGKHLSIIAGILYTHAAELRHEADPDGGHLRPSEWRLLARQRANRITTLEARLADLTQDPPAPAVDPHTSPAPAEDHQKEN